MVVGSDGSRQGKATGFAEIEPSTTDFTVPVTLFNDVL